MTEPQPLKDKLQIIDYTNYSKSEISTVACMIGAKRQRRKDIIEFKSAVEYRKQWFLLNPITIDNEKLNCDICSKQVVLYGHPFVDLIFCEDHIEEHCYPDLFTVEKGGELKRAIHDGVTPPPKKRVSSPSNTKVKLMCACGKSHEELLNKLKEGDE